MIEEEDKVRSASDAEIEQEIREGRKFSPQEALARLAGPGAMEGASPVSPVQQAETEIGNWLVVNVADPVGALQFLLQRNLRGSELLLNSLDRPLSALCRYCQSVIASDYLLADLVREADVEWGRRMDERPHFDREGSPPDPGDAYTIESVRRSLDEVVRQLSGAQA